MGKLDFSQISNETSRRIIKFLNEAKSIQDIRSDFLVDSPTSGKGDQINDYRIGEIVAQRILDRKNSLSNQRFHEINDLDNIDGLGQDKLNDLVYSFSERRTIVLNKLAQKKFNVNVEIYDQETWEEIISNNPEIPTSYMQLKRLGHELFKNSNKFKFVEKSARRGLIRPFKEECEELKSNQYFTGLGNPDLTPQERDSLEEDIDRSIPYFEESSETQHFILRWTNQSNESDDNIADRVIIIQTGEYLEEAWRKYYETFDKIPYVSIGRAKIEVNFYHIGSLGRTNPGGPIILDSKRWINDPGIRQPTSAHELFHRLQYSFGFRNPACVLSGDYRWFSEGSASWAEVFVWQRVSRAYKIIDIFDAPHQNLYEASYAALPFWIFFEKRQQDIGEKNPIVCFFEKYEAYCDERRALSEVILESWPANNVYRTLGTFFALFARERKIGAWKQGPVGAYGNILDNMDNILNPSIHYLEDLPLDPGDSYSNFSAVPEIGSEYYRFHFSPLTDGHTFNLSVAPLADQEISYYLVYDKDGLFALAVFPFSAGTYRLSQTIDRSTWDAITIIISGRGSIARFGINISIGETA